MSTGAQKLLAHTLNQLKSLTFFIEHRTEPSHFSRKSPLNFQTLALLVLNMIKKSIKVELMDFFHQLDTTAIAPSRQAFAQARDKISFRAFQDFFEKSCEIALTADDAKLHKGYRLFAVDGTSFVVGPLEKLKEHFGESTTTAGKAMCRISAVVDVLDACIADAAVAPFASGERKLAIQQVEKLKSVKHALFLFDRGYWSPDLIEAMIENDQRFLMRIASNSADAARTYGDSCLRMYSFMLSSGKKEILATNIPVEEMADEELAALYAMRWSAETKFLELILIPG